MIKDPRKSDTTLNKIYYWTATIHEWLPLLETDFNKQIIIDSLKFLSDRKMITVYGFVIMPTHIHLVWRQNCLNGKETPKGSLLKHSAHLYLKQLKLNGTAGLYEVNLANKKHEIWKRDSLGIEIFSSEFAKQKMDYMHFNPVKGKWKLSKDDLDYHFSSSRFYETGVDEFGFLENIFQLFDGT
jgi:putative transposase